VAARRATTGGATLGDYAARRRRQGRTAMWIGVALFAGALGLRIARPAVAAWLGLAGLGLALIVGGRRHIEVTACPMCGERLLEGPAPPGEGERSACASCGASLRLRWP